MNAQSTIPQVAPIPEILMDILFSKISARISNDPSSWLDWSYKCGQRLLRVPPRYAQDRLVLPGSSVKKSRSRCQ